MSSSFVAGFREKIEKRFTPLQTDTICKMLDQYCCGFDIKVMCTDIAPSVYVFPQELTLFLASKKQDGRMSKASREQYEYCLRDMHMFLRLPLKDITTMHLRSYIEHISKNRITGEPLSTGTINQRKNIIRSYFHWLYEEDAIPKDPAKKIRTERDDAVPREAYTDLEIEKIRNACSCIRDRAIVDLLVSSGIRVSELVGLDRMNVDLNKREMKVFGKGGKWRTAFFDARAAVSMKEYLKSRKDKSKALFVIGRSPHSRITTQGVRYMLHSLSGPSGVKDIIPHRFRHTLATDSINSGMPVESVQILLGHERINTTMHYAHVAKDKVKQDYNRFVR